MPQKSLAIAYNMKRKAQKKKMADGGQVDTPPPSPPVDPSAAASVASSFKKAVHSYADGGEIHAAECPCPKCCGGGEMMAEGGFIGSHQSAKKVDTKPDMGDHEMDKGYVMHEGDVKRPNGMAMSEDGKRLNEHPVDMHAETSMAEQDLVDRIMMNRKQNNAGEAKFAKGGYVEGDEMYPHKEGTMFAVDNKFSEGGRVANQDEIEAGFDPNEFDDLHLRDDLESSYGDDDNAGDALGNKQEDKDRADLVDRIMMRNFKQKIPRGYPGR